MGCERSEEELVGAMILTESSEEFRFLASEAVDLGDTSIPVFLAVLNRHVEQPVNLTEHSKISICLKHLRDLARQGIYSIQEVPALLHVLEEQLVYVPNSLVAAELLQMITGLDVGYDEEFLKNYTVAAEPERLRMLAKWRDWYNKEVGRVE
jgi:hypothetical protein